MRLGLIADIHEQVESLRAALERCRRERVDQIVVLGDVFETGQRIEETCRLLAEARAVGVWGNHDFGLCSDPTDEMRARYPAVVLEFMTSLRPRLEVNGCYVLRAGRRTRRTTVCGVRYDNFRTGAAGMLTENPGRLKMPLLLSLLVILVGLFVSAAAADEEPARPRMYFADAASGRPFSKDPAVVKFQGRYLLYYSLPPYSDKPSKGWSIGVAASGNLVDWKKIGELANEGPAEQNGFCAPGAIVLRGRIHLFYQTYGNGPRDAICHAWSEDGLRFTRNPTNPIFHPTGQWTCGRAIDADVIEHEGRLLLYWATRDPAFKVQMQGVAAAPLDSDFTRERWTQLNPDGPILKPELPWERQCIEAAAMARHDGRLYMFYAGGYNNEPQQIGVAVSDDGVHFTRLSDQPFLPNGPPGAWNSSESGHPYLFQDDDGRDYLFYQGNNDRGRSWYLSMIPIAWKDGKPLPAETRP